MGTGVTPDDHGDHRLRPSAAVTAEPTPATRDATDDSRPAGAIPGHGDAWRNRIRLEHQLHDGPALRLSALTLRLGLLRHRTDDPAIRAGLEQAQDELDAVLAELRSVAHQIYPPLLDEAGLGPALRQVAEGLAVTVEVVDATEPPTGSAGGSAARFGPAVEGETYYAVVDCLVGLPPDGPDVQITIGAEDDHLLLGVTGPDPAQSERLQEACRALGGRVAVTTPEGRTTTTARIPCA